MRLIAPRRLAMMLRRSIWSSDINPMGDRAMKRNAGTFAVLSKPESNEGIVEIYQHELASRLAKAMGASKSVGSRRSRRIARMRRANGRRCGTPECYIGGANYNA